MKYFKDASGWVIILNLSILFTSCSTTKKIKSFTKTTVDSVSVVKIDSSTLKAVDSTSVKKDNTITTIEKQDDYEKETVIEFDTVNHSSEKSPAEDYFSPIIKITIKEKGIKKEKSSIQTNILDSSRKLSTETADLRKITDTKLHKTETVKNKEVKRTSYWGWLWIGIITIAVIIAGWYFRVWPWLFAFLKRKEEYPIIYKKK